jgi:hypothetical protein
MVESHDEGTQAAQPIEMLQATRSGFRYTFATDLQIVRCGRC